MQITTQAAEFRPVTFTIENETELADLVGALGAYGKGVTKCAKTLREAGLLEHYSGNARKTARTVVAILADKVGFPEPEFGTGAKGALDEELFDSASEG